MSQCHSFLSYHQIHVVQAPLHQYHQILLIHQQRHQNHVSQYLCCYSFYLLFSVPVGEIIGIVIGGVLIVGVIAAVISLVIRVVRRYKKSAHSKHDVPSNGIELCTCNYMEQQEVPVNKILSVFNYLLFSFRMILIAKKLLFQRMLRMLIKWVPFLITFVHYHTAQIFHEL